VIPCLATVRLGGHRRRGIRLWLPLFLLWPLILPFAVVLAVAGAVIARAYGVAAAGALRTAWQLASGLRGMHIEVDGPEVAFQVRFI
jgi:hypothetical protein